MIYLDNAATSLRRPPCVIEAVAQAMQSLGNSGRGVNGGSLSAARVIYDARQKLADYAKTADYREKLCSSLTEMAAILPAEGTVYSVGPADADKIAVLEAICPKGSSIRTADDIQLGGLRGENAAAGIITDDTLDTRLELQREWFTKHSGLTVE